MVTPIHAPLWFKNNFVLLIMFVKELAMELADDFMEGVEMKMVEDSFEGLEVVDY
jgi:hypothetical protein